MNGLYERTFVYPVRNMDDAGAYADTNDPNSFNSGVGVDDVSPYPGYTGTSIMHSVPDWATLRELSNFTPLFEDQFRRAGIVEAEFIRRWRGVTRTAIVDVPNTLELEIPAFDPSEFFYFDTDGVKQTIEASQRIDLLFIYSKAVDQSQTTVASYSNGSPLTLTEPALGIVKGAGIGVNQTISTTLNTREDRLKIQSLDGVTLMLPNPSDELSENTGFTTVAGVIKGSFPSPDDLMNLAPLISDKLSEDATPLIGQSILPVAYIVVKKLAEANSVGTSIITNDDIIDIRPLLRTTELSYNERAGIAAAHPQISLGNPAVSESFIERVSTDLVNDYNGKITGINNRLLEQSRVVAAGSIKGGMYYGVEGALASYVRSNNNVQSYQAAKEIVESRYGYPAGSIPDLPDWDVASWCKNGSFGEKGQYPNDRINYSQFGMNWLGGNTSITPLAYGPFSSKPALSDGVPIFDPALNPRIDRLGTDSLAQFGDGVNNINAKDGVNVQYFVSKTINIDKTATPWASDYFVSVQLWNCVPLSCRTGMNVAGRRHTGTASTANIWVDKRADYFTIYVSWVANDPLANDGAEDHNEYLNSEVPSQNRNSGGKYAGFSVINNDIIAAPNPNQSSTAPSVTTGVSLYPTVTFQVIGIPESAKNASANLNTINPVLSLQ